MCDVIVAGKMRHHRIMHSLILILKRELTEFYLRKHKHTHTHDIHDDHRNEALIGNSITPLGKYEIHKIYIYAIYMCRVYRKFLCEFLIM